MKLSGGSASVWPGYVAAVASLLLSLLLLAGVLVVAISQVGRIVGSYNRQLLSEVVDDERRTQQIGELDRRAQALNSARVAAAASRPATAPVPVPALAPASAPERSQEQALDAQLRQKAAELTAAQSDWARLDAQLRQLSLAAASTGTRKVVRITFGAGAQGLQEQAIQELRTALSAQDLAGQRRWLIEAGAKGLNVVASREVFRLMVSLRSQLQEMGLPADRVRLVLDAQRSPQEFSGSVQSGDVVILLRPDAVDGVTS